MQANLFWLIFWTAGGCEDASVLLSLIKRKRNKKGTSIFMTQIFFILEIYLYKSVLSLDNDS